MWKYDFDFNHEAWLLFLSHFDIDNVYFMSYVSITTYV